jgi:hypothetical protein
VPSPKQNNVESLPREAVRRFSGIGYPRALAHDVRESLLVRARSAASTTSHFKLWRNLSRVKRCGVLLTFVGYDLFFERELIFGCSLLRHDWSRRAVIGHGALVFLAISNY